MISKSQEEYLKNMYILDKQKGVIRVTDIANKMGLTKASVNKSLKILKENKFVDYETYGTIKLTVSGRKLARKMLEAYDIVYLFLKDVLNIESNEAKINAEKIKLVADDNTINSLARYVHKVLDLSSLDCCYDINKDKCINCFKVTSRIKRNIKLKEENLIGKRMFVKNR